MAANTNDKALKYKEKTPTFKIVLAIFFAAVSVFYVMPIIIVLYNSFKTNSGIASNLFALPGAESFNGIQNYVKGMTFGNYPFWQAALWSVFITLGDGCSVPDGNVHTFGHSQ